MVLKLEQHQNHLKSLLNHTWRPIPGAQEVWGGAQGLILLKNSQMMLMVWKPHFENH